MAKQISELSWQNRLLIISYENKDDEIFSKTKKFISDFKCEIKDRNLEIIFFKKFDNRNFSTPHFVKKRYGIWLIGYDGSIKDYSPDDKILFNLFDLIDAMPMRKNEIIDDKC